MKNSDAQAAGTPEPIAIIGMGKAPWNVLNTARLEIMYTVGRMLTLLGCRLPGVVNSPSELWQMLQENRSGQCKTPQSRWNADAFYHPDPEYAGSVHHDGGYFINDDIKGFDNSFFGINKQDATSMDPAQRNLLEVVYECLESAGTKLEDVSGRNIGCYVGSFATDFINISLKDADRITRYGGTGFGTTILANRISHIFNLAGPSFVVDTACSSSLYALHNAFLALQAEETEAAIVCGSNLLMSPEQHIATVKIGVLSSTSTCHSFDESADGYGRADGISVLYIKRLSDAIKNRDPVRSVIRGTALNCNGRTFGITLPSIEGQEAVIRRAYSKAGIAPRETDFVECHGTGTKVGDPIEVEALSRVFSDERKYPLLLGSVKTNVGHSEAASGIASIIKASLMLEHAMIPPTHGVQKLNSNIKSEEWNVRVVTQNEPWPGASLGKPRRVSINSFGYGGANAHAILENFESAICDDTGSQDARLDNDWTYILPFSAKTQSGLTKRVQALGQSPYLDHALRDLAYTLGCRRSFFPERGFLLAQSGSLVENIQEKHLVTNKEGHSRASMPIAMIFTGQGAQWSQMGLTLIERNAYFRSRIRSLDIVLQELLDPPSWSIEHTLQERAGESNISHPSRSQPVCTAIQIALVDLLQKWGIKPQVVIGHSSGEIAAAYAASFITSQEAMAIAYYRGIVVARSTFKGAMMAVGLGEEEAAHEITIAGLEKEICVACKNSSQTSTISGSEEAINTLCERLTERKIFARKLLTSGIGYHSHGVADIAGPYQDYLSTSLKLHRSAQETSAGRMISSVTGTDITGDRARRPSYWRQNLESPVEFAKAINTALKDGSYHFVEIGPHSALELPLKQIHLGASADIPFRYASLLTRGVDAVGSTLKAIGNLFVSGHNVNFGLINAILSGDGIASDKALGKVPYSMPRYPWEHETALWSESRMSSGFRFRKHPRHELLGSIIPGGDTGRIAWHNLLRLREVPWLAGRRLDQKSIFPEGCYVAMVVEALSQIAILLANSPSFSFRSVRFFEALVLPSDSDDFIELFTHMNRCKISQARDSKIWYQFEIVSMEGDNCRRHATGSVCVAAREKLSMSISTSHLDWEPELESELESASPQRYYEHLASCGLSYGPSFQLIKSMHIGRHQSEWICKSQIQASDSGIDELPNESRFTINPAIFDAMLQTGLVANREGKISQLRPGRPVSIEKLIFTPSQSKSSAGLLNVQAIRRKIGCDVSLLDLEVRDPDSLFMAGARGVRMHESEASEFGTQPPPSRSILESVWKPDIDLIQPSNCRQFADYVDQDRILPSADCSKPKIRKLASILDIILHKRPACRILHIDAPSSEDDALGKAILEVTGYKTNHQRRGVYVRGALEANGEINLILGQQEQDDEVSRQRSDDDRFDIIVCREIRVLESYFAGTPQRLEHLIASNAWILCSEGDCTVPPNARSFDFISACHSTSDWPALARLNCTANESLARSLDQIILVIPNEESEVVLRVAAQDLETAMLMPCRKVKLRDINSEKIPSGTIVVSLVEFERSVLPELAKVEMEAIKIIHEKAQGILWVTGGGLVGATKPNMSVALGFYRTMRIEHHPTKFITLDVDYPASSIELIAQSIASVILALGSRTIVDDEYILHNGLIHISRMMPSSHLKSSVPTRRYRETITVPRRAVGAAHIALRQPGNLSTIVLQQHPPALDRLQANEVEVEILALGLNARDMDVLRGSNDNGGSSCLLECTGAIRVVGAEVLEFQPGDRVVVMAPCRFSTVVRVAASCCCKLPSEESYLEMATVPLSLSTALYALRDRARLQPNESVLIHAATSGFGQAAIHVAKLIGANVFASARTVETRKYLQEVFDIAPNHVFDSHDVSFEASIGQVTAGRGVDVVLNTLSGDLLHASWRCVAEFGRFIELGRRDISEAGLLDMTVFGRAASFSAFDLTDLYYSKNPTQNHTWTQLLHESVEETRKGAFLSSKPLEVFTLSNIQQAFQRLTDRNFIGRVVIDVADLGVPSPIETDFVDEAIPDKYTSLLSSIKTYLMVGCLGGIGRYLSRWMMSRGARNFVFISRTGTDKQAAKLLVNDLTLAGASVKVVKGDVSNVDAVAALIESADTAIGGVVQAAMTLKQALFSQMTVSDWHAGLLPKVKGTWNLHHSLQGHDNELDFFVMTSSITGTIGQATESNYTAANAFLDTFAQYRRNLGLPGTSIVLGAVKGIGYLAEHPEAQAMLQRQGLTPIDEEELLQVVDLAITGYQGLSQSNDTSLDRASIVTGLDIQTSGHQFMQDPRASILNFAVSRTGSNGIGTSKDHGNALPEPLAEQLRSGDKQTLHNAVDDAIAEKLATLVQISAEQITAETKVVDIGMDSMLAVEARQHATLGVDVPLTKIMEPNTRVHDIGDTVAQSLMEGQH